jgi:hypothetical protein
MARPKKPEFDAQEFAKRHEQEAMARLVENMRSAQDEQAQNDAAYKLWAIANSYETVH